MKCITIKLLFAIISPLALPMEHIFAEKNLVSIPKTSAVTYGFSGGRLGDNLLSYAHALWVSYKRGIPLLYRPFKNSDQLQLSCIHDSYDTVTDQEFTKFVNLSERGGIKYNIFDLKIDENILYMVPYFPHGKLDTLNYDYSYFDLDWNDEGFVEALRKGIKYINKLPELDLPKDCLSVAVHIRTGEGFDHTLQLRKPDDQAHPLKFPPNSFFIEQLKRMSELLEDQPLYVHIFTDSPRPEYFAMLLEKEVNKANITYGFRRNSSLLDDFFAITQFKYLIRGESNFAFMASILAQCKICITPANYIWKDPTHLVITEVETIMR